MTSKLDDGRADQFDAAAGAIAAPEHDELDNGSTTDTLQWCELHCGNCPDVVPVRRVYPDYPDRTHIFLACQGCARNLKKAGLLQDSEFARHGCYEIQVPKGLCKGRRKGRSKPRRSEQRAGEKSFEVTLDALQVTYLRALGLLVIPA